MDFSDDDDFCCRIEQEETYMGHEDESFQPEEEMMPPEDDCPPSIEEISAEVAEVSVSPPSPSRQTRDEAVVVAATLPLVETESSSPGSSSSSPIRPAENKRSRLSDKTVPQGYWAMITAALHTASLQPPSVPGVTPVEAVDSDWWEEKTDRQKYQYVYNLLKRVNAYGGWKLTLRKRVRDRLPETWTELEQEDRDAFLVWFEKNHHPPLLNVVKCWIWEGLLQKIKTGRGGHWEEKRQGPRFLGMQVVLTWQGDWGLLLSDILKQTKCAREATEILKNDRYVISLWTKAKKILEGLKGELAADEWSGSLELCTRTFEAGTVRIHLHACFVSTGSRLQPTELQDLKIFGSVPHMSSEDKKKARRRRATQFSGFYYLSAPKIGSIFQHSTMRAHHDYEVNAEWIWAMIATHKIELAAARKELIASGKNLSRHLPNLDLLEKERQQTSISAMIECRAKLIGETRNEFVQIEAVSNWVKDALIARDRRKFLVLDGPSRMGKTAFACSLVGRGETLEVNCAGVSDPPLRAFSRSHHRLILFDEAGTDMVLRNRRLFQAPNTAVTVGSSPTNALAYELYLNDTLLVVASNSWERELAALPPGERAWLDANMVYVLVKQKLFKET